MLLFWQHQSGLGASRWHGSRRLTLGGAELWLESYFVYSLRAPSQLCSVWHGLPAK